MTEAVASPRALLAAAANRAYARALLRAAEALEEAERLKPALARFEADALAERPEGGPTT